MEFDVTFEREKWIGGSDLPAIFNISPFKTRWELLLEKAGLREETFTGNKYTEYGKVMEPKIRSYLNKLYFTEFLPSKRQNGDLRAHTDGFDGVFVAEIKTTSHIYKTVGEYKIYLLQLLFYLREHGVHNGILAVYSRPADFNEEFDPERLQVFEIKAGDYEVLTAEIYKEIDRFREDLAKLKANPLLTEKDFQPTELVALSEKVVELEEKMAAFKKLEAHYKAMKQKLYEAMRAAGVKSWTMPNDTKIARIDETPASTKTVEEFDLEAFRKDNPDLYAKYLKEVVKETAGKAGYARITLPKGSGGEQKCMS